MLFSLSLIFILGITLGSILKKIHIPNLLGMLITGIILGPYTLNLISMSVINISADLRQIALIIILTRAGLSIDIKDLLKVGRPAILMCFVPACFEIVGMVIFAPKILGVSVLEALILGTVIAAVSPAVIVPKMLKLMKEGYGTKKGIPQLIMAGASVDDVFVIVLFTAFTSLASGGEITITSLITIPTSIILGIAIGITTGIAIGYFFKKAHMRDTIKVIIFLSIAFLLVTIEHSIEGNVGFSGLLAVMSMGVTLKNKNNKIASRLSNKFSKLWVAAEVLLFVLVGATVDIKYAVTAGIGTILIIFIVIAFRMLGVYVSLIKTKLDKKERIFCMFAYMPKATVQAAIGAIPLTMGLACGKVVLTVAVVSILITAPLGAFIIDTTYKKWTTKEVSEK